MDGCMVDEGSNLHADTSFCGLLFKKGGFYGSVHVQAMTLSYVLRTNWEQVKSHFWEIYTIKAFCFVFFFFQRGFWSGHSLFSVPYLYLCYTVFIPSVSDKKANIKLHHFMGCYKKTTSGDNEHKSLSYRISLNNSRPSINRLPRIIALPPSFSWKYLK